MAPPFRIKLSPIKRSLPATPIVPIVNSPAVESAATAVASAPPFAGVPVPVSTRRSSVFGVSDAKSAAPTPAPMAVQANEADAVLSRAVSPQENTGEVAAATEAAVGPEAVAAFGVNGAIEGVVVGSDEQSVMSMVAAGPGVPLGATVAPMPADAAVTGMPASGADGSGALLVESNKPSQVRAMGLTLKWSMYGAMGLAVAYVVIKFAVPFINEMQHPGSTAAIHDKDANTAVRMIQQTREVVAKNDAKAAYLNEVVAADQPQKPVEAKPEALPPPPPKPVAAPVVANDLTRYTLAVEQLKIDSVVSGAAPRLFIGGRIVKQGDVVDRALKLTFAGVDVEAHAVWFTNADNVVFRKYY